MSLPRTSAPPRAVGGSEPTVVREVRTSGDRGDVIVGWFLKLTIVLLILGVAAFDGLSIATTKLSATDNASAAALAASDSWNADHSGPMAYAAAKSNAQQNNATVITHRFRIDPDGTVHVSVRKTAHTVVVQHLSWLRHWTTQQSTATAKDMS